MLKEMMQRNLGRVAFCDEEKKDKKYGIESAEF